MSNDELTSALDCALHGDDDDSLQRMMFILSHDLNAPLRQIKSFSELLQKKYSGQLDEKGELWLTLLHSGSDKMQKMLDGILQYSRIWTNKDPFTEIDLNELMKEIVLPYQRMIAEKYMTFSWTGLPTIYGIKSLWTIVLTELVRNATYFQPEGRIINVELSFKKSPTGGVLSVVDNGLGVDEKYHEKLTDMFFRYYGENEYPGTGIGLSLCQRVLQRHASSLSFSSNNVNGLTVNCHLKSDYLVDS